LNKFFLFVLLITAFAVASCSSYKQNILFSAKEGKGYETMAKAAESNYRIQKNDILSLDVFTPAEKVIDPIVAAQSGNVASDQSANRVTYLVDINGMAKLPIIGELKVEGLTIREAETLLQKEYSRLYTDIFISLRFTNKRVIVLGTTHGMVVPLANENTRLTEVLAISKAITNDAKAHNIRIIRENKIYTVDLTGIQDYVNNDMLMMANDIIYVEPIRRPFVEGLRDYGIILSIVTSLSTLVLVVINSTK
jgi:polysaccharide export outer membrane protein